MEDLIPIINKLQSVFKTTGILEVKLPQIVVVGAQSSGKSSVLESLVKKPFLPRGTGIVTRCPIIIQLNQIKDGRKYAINPADNELGDNWKLKTKKKKKPENCPKLQEVGQGSSSPSGAGVEWVEAEEWCKFVEGDSPCDNFPKKVFIDFDQVREAIEYLQVEMAGDKKGISMEPIILEVYSPNVIDLTVVDLPGIVKVVLEGQPDDIEEQVHNLVLKFIKDESAIILAVSAANADIATSESIKIAKTVDPTGDRTIAVVTKLDLMDRGTDAGDLLRGDTIHVKLGIIGVVNRSQEDINNNKSMEETLSKEDSWLSSVYPELYALGRIGTPQLAKSLNELLKNHIHENLPALITRIATLTDECQTTLAKLGKEISSDPIDCAWLILKTVGKFISEFEKVVHYRPRNLTDVDKDLFAVDVNKAFNELREEIVFDPDVFDASKILKMLNNTQNYEGFSSIEQVFKARVKQEIKKMEGPAISCAQKVHDLLSRTAGACFDDPRLKYLNAVIKAAVDELLDVQLHHVKTGIKQHIMLESRMIFSTAEEFVRLLTSETEEATEADEDEIGRSSRCTAFPLSTEHGATHSSDLKISRIQLMIQKYLEIVKQGLSDYIPKYAMFHLADETIDGIADAVNLATRGKETVLVSEPPDNRVLRKRQQEMLKNLQDAEKIIKDIKTQG